MEGSGWECGPGSRFGFTVPPLTLEVSADLGPAVSPLSALLFVCEMRLAEIHHACFVITEDTMGAAAAPVLFLLGLLSLLLPFLLLFLFSKNNNTITSYYYY